MTINMGMTFDNSRNDYFKAQLKAKGLGVNQAGKFALLHHEPTKTEWTDEEFIAHGQKFIFQREAREIYLEDYMNFRHEEVRRIIEGSRNHHEFGNILEDFNPFSSNSTNNRIQRHDPQQMFQRLADSFVEQKNTIHIKHETFNGRFSSEDDLELHLYALLHHFNEAVESLASMFTVRADFNAVFINGDASTIDRAFHDATKIGHFIRDHIWSGGSTDNIQSLLEQNGFSEAMQFLNNICLESRNFEEQTSDGRRTKPLIDHTQDRISHLVSSDILTRMQIGIFTELATPIIQLPNEIMNANQNTVLQLLDGFGDTNQNIELI